MSSIKDHLLSVSDAFLSERIRILTEAIADSRRSSWEDTKSSAGDKYETGREMIQGEIEQNSRQLEEAQKLTLTLDLMKNSDSPEGSVVVGSLVTTSQGSFYLGIPVGMVDWQGKAYALISSLSPIGLQLLGKKTGDSFLFHEKKYTLLGVE